MSRFDALPSLYANHYFPKEGSAMIKTQKREIFRGLLVVACCLLLSAGCKKDDSTATGPGTPGPGATITVSGKVIGSNNQPQSGVPVLIIGTSIPSVNTDANGNFTISNVTTPYNIAVVDGASKASLVYKGLTRSDPTLMWIDVAPGTPRTATLNGKIYPATAYPEPPTRKSKAAFASPELNASTNVNGTTGAYSINATWYGPTTTTGTVYALQWSYNTTTNLPTSYDGFGSRSGVSLLDATTNPNGNDTMSVVSSATFSGNVTVASGYTLNSKSLSVMFANNGIISLFSDPTPSSSFSYLTPDAPGATMFLSASASKPSGQSSAFRVGLSPSATGVALSVPAAPELSLPIDATTGVTKSSLFSWTPVTGGIQVVIFQAGAGKPRYLVLTAAAADSIPDLTAAGLGLPAATAYTWSVYSFGPFASADAAAGASGFLGALVGLFTSDGYTGRSSIRSFTTAP